MEARLTKLVLSLLDLANVRNLDINNPVVLTLKSELDQDVTVIVSFREPFTGRWPLNVLWLDVDPQSPNFKKLFKRVSKLPDVPNNHQHTWTSLYYYADAFNPPQYYDATDSGSNANVDLNNHIANHNNPHVVTAAQLGALPLAGGTLTGPIILAAAPTEAMHPVTKQYFDDKFLILDSEFEMFQLAMGPLSINLRNAVDVIIPQVVADNAANSATVAALVGRVTTLETANTSTQTALTNLTPRVATLESLQASDGLRIAALETGLNSAQSTIATLPKKYVHTQTVASAIWTIVHNTNNAAPTIQIWNAGEVIVPNQIVSLNANTVEVRFNVAYNGSATIVG